jgi:hypothetical protein
MPINEMLGAKAFVSMLHLFDPAHFGERGDNTRNEPWAAL